MSNKQRNAVNRTYSDVAATPEGDHPFPVGRPFAESVGYPTSVLDTIPPLAVEAFAGVSNVSIWADMPVGATVVDVGCGAGLDALIAAQRVGSIGHVVAVDFSAEMVDRAQQAVQASGLTHIEVRQADAEHLPLADGMADIVMVNGIFNLNPHRDQIFQELARILRPGGQLFAAEIITHAPLAQEEQNNPTNWLA
jgi:arsenite methyltransferase